MPELPEVETTRRGVDRYALMQKITGVRILVPKMLKEGFVSDPALFAAFLVSDRIVESTRRGKYLIFRLESGYYLLFHLKMRGHLVVEPTESADEKYLALGISLDNGQEVRFYDIWTWGEFRLLSSQGLSDHAGLSKMGVEPLTEDFTGAAFQTALRRRPNTTIKAALLDQTLVAGVGNIYADESLFRSGIRPDRPAGSLTETEVDLLRSAIQTVLTEAIGDGGTVSDNYFDADGRPGRYEPQVYDRGGKPCARCGTTLTRTRITGRGTVYCAACQS